MSWLKDILAENRRVVESWPAWKRGAIMTRDEFIRDLEYADDIFHGEDFSSYAKRLATHDADQRAVIDTLNELVKAKEARCDKYRAEITRLREALQLLHDHQNGCPLPSYEEGWTRAMALTQEALKEQSQ